MADRLYLGIDIGTSGARGVAIDAGGSVVGMAQVAMPPPDRVDGTVSQAPEVWWSAVMTMLDRLSGAVDFSTVAALAVDGTSGTLLLTDASGAPSHSALMYNDASAAREARRIAEVAPADSGAIGATSALAKLLKLSGAPGMAEARHALHQADWIAGRLTGSFGWSDENNALKLGYDPVARSWPAWLGMLGARLELLPRVVEPGRPLGPLAPGVARRFGFSADAIVAAGTTDGVAAFLATGASEPGEAVTSLGSTLVLKILSEAPLFDPASGVYSHRLGDRWLPGGASNTGGAALARFFNAAEIERLTPLLDPSTPTGLDYYPLPAPGERFPINDPALAPRVEPRPADDARFLQGLLEAIARIEADGYAKLRALGGPPLKSVRAVGGGAANAAWSEIRARLLGVPLLAPVSEHAAYGTARLARRAIEGS